MPAGNAQAIAGKLRSPVSTPIASDGSGNYLTAVAENRMSVPSKMLAMMNALVKPSMPGGGDCGKCYSLFSSGFQPEPYIMPHGQNGNTLLCDGHVGG